MKGRRRCLEQVEQVLLGCHIRFRSQAVADHPIDIDQTQPVSGGELEQDFARSDLSSLVEDATDGRRRCSSRQTDEIEAGLHLPGPLHHSTGAHLDRRDMPRHHDIPRTRATVDRDPDRFRAIRCGNAGRDPLASLEGDSVGNPAFRSAISRHQRDTEPPERPGNHGEADEATGVYGHEADVVGRRQISGNAQFPA